jgi:hypothetical protein
MIRMLVCLVIVALCGHCWGDHKTVVDIHGREFWINGQPTYKGREYQGKKVQGLLLNARMVQGVFDDANPETRDLWKYPDGAWDAQRNTREFVAAMPAWRAHGLIAFTINFQGGSPQGYSNKQPWENSAFEHDGGLRADYLARMEKILDKADELGMVVILGYFYFGQEYRLDVADAPIRAVDNATDWLLAKGYTNVVVEIANETNSTAYNYALLKPARCGELVQRVQERSKGKVKNAAGRLLVSTSFTGGVVPPDNLAASADFLLLHGNGVKDPAKIVEMVGRCRKLKGYNDQPILFNEDDHFDFDKPGNNFFAAISAYAGWGYFDYRMGKEGFDEGYQSVPVNWGISSQRKRGFFELLSEITGEGK